MIQEGKITSDEGMDLLKALEETKKDTKKVSLSHRYLRIEIVSEHGKNVNVKVPLNFIKIASKFATFIPKEAREELEANEIRLDEIDFEEIVTQIDQGLSDGKLVDVEAENTRDGSVRIKIYVE